MKHFKSGMIDIELIRCASELDILKGRPLQEEGVLLMQ